MALVRWKDKAQKTVLTGTEPIPITDDSDGDTDKHTTPDDVETFVLSGKAGGRTLTGGTDSGDDLALSSTSNATKGTVRLGDAATGMFFDEVNERLSIGGPGNTFTFAGIGPIGIDLAIHNDEATETCQGTFRYSNTATQASCWNGLRSRGTQASPTVVQAGDVLGLLSFFGYDGTDYEFGAYIAAEVDGAPGNNDMPGRLRFLTTPDGSQTPVEALRLRSDQSAAFASHIDLTEISEPSSPAANVARQYAFDDGGVTKLAFKDSAGNITVLGEGGAVGEAATLAALKALDAGSFNAVVMQGYTSAGDGGGGVFRWDSSDLSTEVTADTQSGIYVPPDSDSDGSSGAWVRIHQQGYYQVAWFGAVGDGSTNDSPAIDAAIEYMKSVEGGILYFEAKAYAVAANPGIVVDDSAIHLQGIAGGYVFGGFSGQGTSLLYTGADGGTIVQFQPPSGTMSSVSLKGFTLRANSLANVGLRIGTVHDYLIEQVDVETRDNASAFGVFLYDNIAAGSVFNYQGTLRKVTVSAAGGSFGFFLEGANGVGGGRHPAFISFHDCRATITDGDGFYLRACDDCYFWNCAVSRTGGGSGDAIVFYGSNSTELRAAQGNYFFGFHTNAGINVIPGTDFNPYGNKVFSTSVDNQVAITDSGGWLYYEDLGSQTVVPRVRTPIIKSNGVVRCTANFAKTEDTTLADITGLSIDVAAGETYKIRAVIHTFITGGSAGGVKAAMGGTATITSARLKQTLLNLNGGSTAYIAGTTTATFTNQLASGSTSAAALIEFEGTVTINAAGTITVQFAQNSSNATASTVLAGSSLEIWHVD